VLGTQLQRRPRTSAALILVAALVAVVAPTPIDRARHAAAVPAGAVADPPALEPDDAASAWIDRAETAEAAAGAAAAAPPKSITGAPRVPPAEDDASVLVTFASDVSASDAEAIVEQTGAEAEPITGTDTVEVTAAEPDLAGVAAELTAEPDVEAVEPNRVRSASRVPNDQSYPSQQPYLTRIGAPTAWDVADTGASTVLAVLDTGVDRDHPDLAPNLVTGRDVVNRDADPSDDNGHGTAVAGVVGAVTGNGTGVAGVAWNAKIMPVKVLRADGTGFDGDIAAGITWAADHGADIINLSLGGFGSSTALDQAIDYALARDVLVVAAAGNEAAGVPSYPAAIPGVLAVAATDAQGQFAWFSNHGPWITLAAPGIGIVSTALAAGPTPAIASATGTSFSSPIVAGVAALVRERHPAWRWDKVAYELVRTARDSGPAGVDDAYGFGIVDAAAALDVGPHGTVSAPNRVSDAPNLPSPLSLPTVATSLSETIAYEYDEDWFAFDAPATSRVTVSVRPPEFGGGGRARELDPVVEIYGPGGGLVASSDATSAGEVETIEATVGPGRHSVRVRNYLASASPGPYSVRVTLTGPVVGGLAWQESSSHPIGSFERGVAVAEVTGDGRDDAVVPTGASFDEQNDFKLFVVPQQANGTLGAPTPLPTHATHLGEGDVAAGDFDHDGDDDVALATVSGLDVAWQGEAGLGDPSLYQVGSVDRLVATPPDPGGAQQLIASGPGGIRELAWNGNDIVATAVATEPVSNFAAGDLTGDGRTDVATLSTTAVTIHARQPDGSFAPTIPLDLTAAGEFLRGVAVGDVSADGRPDLVVSISGDTARLTYLLQQPDGSLGEPVGVGLSHVTGSPDSLRLADVTDDGLSDAVVVYPNSGVAIVAQATTGGLSGSPEFVNIAHDGLDYHDAVAVGDLNHDGLNDLASASDNHGLVVRHRLRAGDALAEGAGPWITTSSPLPHVTGVPSSTAVGVTFGRDLLGSSVSGDTVHLLDGRSGDAVDASLSRTGRTVALTPARPLTPGVPYQIFIAGVRDAVGEFAPVITIPFVTAPAAPPTYSVNGTYSPVSGDLDANGFDDIVWYGPGAVADSLWLFDGDGRRSVPISVRGTYTTAAGDFDGNGHDDILWYGPGTAADSIWYSGPSGIVSRSTPVSGTYTPITADFDRNGYDDILWYGRGTIADSVWYFSASGRTSRAITVRGLYRPMAGDFNRDGFGDVFWYAPGSGAESVWYGGSAGFRAGSAPGVAGTYTTRVLDANGDGYDDLFWYSSTAAFFWRNGPSGFTSLAVSGMPTGMRPVAGELTGDGRDDLFAYVPGATADRLRPGTPGGMT
jgi:type VII secretion-associated serine protease mycosin